MWSEVLLIPGAYILGSAPHLKLLAKLRHVELDGDFHQSLWRKAGKMIGVTGVVGEFIKGILPVLVGKALDFNMAVVAGAGLAAVVGQMWPVFSKFDGEKGNSIGLAMSMALAPISCLIALTPVIIALLIRTAPRVIVKAGSGEGRPIVGGPYSRSLPVGMAICFLILPFIAWYRGEPRETVWCLSALFIFIMIRRLTAGLRHDLKAGNKIKRVLLRRLLYDRATTAWRQEERG
jgi:glycerol-3-phosphate acyltransferase PlsY